MNKTEDVILPLRLLCLDIDGTLLDTAHQLPPENRAAVFLGGKNSRPPCQGTR